MQKFIMRSILNNKFKFYLLYYNTKMDKLSDKSILNLCYGIYVVLIIFLAFLVYDFDKDSNRFRLMDQLSFMIPTIILLIAAGVTITLNLHLKSHRLAL